MAAEADEASADGAAAEVLVEAQERAVQLEADLRRSGEYGQLLLQRVERLEGENQHLRDQAAAVEQADLQSSQEHSLELEKLRQRLERLEEENRQLQEQADASAVSFSSRTRVRTETEPEEQVSPSSASGHGARSRGRSDDHRLSDVIRQNEDLTDQLQQLERDRQALREENEELQQRASSDAKAKDEWQANEEKQRMKTEQKQRHKDIMHSAVDKIKAEGLRDAKDSEIEDLKACVEQLRQQGAHAQEESCCLREQLAAVRTECLESGSLLAQTQELLSERETEAEALRGQIRQLQGALEAESYTPKDHDNSHSLAAEMAVGPREEDEELGLPPTQRVASTQSKARRTAAAEAPPPRRSNGMDQPLLSGAADPLRSAPPWRRSGETPEAAAAAGLGAVAAALGAAPREATEGEDLRVTLTDLRTRNIELAGECDRLRTDVAAALRWERRWLFLALAMLALLLVAVLRRWGSSA